MSLTHVVRSDAGPALIAPGTPTAATAPAATVQIVFSTDQTRGSDRPHRVAGTCRSSLGRWQHVRCAAVYRRSVFHAARRSSVIAAGSRPSAVLNGIA